jgi:hypothetical protein
LWPVAGEILLDNLGGNAVLFCHGESVSVLFFQ